MSSEEGYLTRKDLVDRLSDKGYFTKKASNKMISHFSEVLEEAFVNGESVKVRGLGMFEVRYVKEHAILHPATRERIIVPGHNVVRFIPSEKLKKEIATGFIVD